MIRFIDITKDYFVLKEDEKPICKICAFINTTSDVFIINDFGQHTFHSILDVKNIPLRETRERCLVLVPIGFFDTL